MKFIPFTTLGNYRLSVSTVSARAKVLFHFKAMDDIGVIMTPFKDVVEDVLVVSC